MTVWAQAGMTVMGEKNNWFRQKLPLTLKFYGSPSPPTSLGSDTRVRREVYGGFNLGELGFQLFSILIV